MPISLLEIGIDKGDSLLMWQKYFPNADILGIDLREGYEYLHEKGIKTMVLDHSNAADLEVFASENKDKFDIIIEDGSHQSKDTILTFEKLFICVKSGGYYVMEDMLCDQDPRWHPNENTWNDQDNYDSDSSIYRVKEMIDEVQMTGLVSHDNLCSNKRKQINKVNGGGYFDYNIEWVFNSMGLTIIKKI
jgi:hypothetical protein